LASKRIEKFAIRRKADARASRDKRLAKAGRRLMRDARLRAGRPDAEGLSGPADPR
jgi:hypothetical protein